MTSAEPGVFVEGSGRGVSTLKAPMPAERGLLSAEGDVCRVVRAMPPRAAVAAALTDRVLKHERGEE